MDVTTRNRKELKSYFVKNSIPTETNFAELIDGLLNQKDDGLVKLPGNPLSVEAAGDSTSEKKALQLYQSFNDQNPAWSLSLNPRASAGDAASARLGLNISDGEGKSRLFIDRTSGNAGLGTISPVAKLDILSANRSGTHPTAVKGLYVTGDFAADSDGVEFRHSNATQGIGFGFNTIYATGSQANQDLGLKARGTGVIKIQSNVQVTGTVTVTGGKITPATGNSWNEGIIFPTDQFGGSGNAAWITYHNARGDKKGTLEIGIQNTADDHIYLRTTGNVGVGASAPVAKLDVLSATRSGTHPTAVKGLYVTGTFGADSDGVEFRHTNGTQGIGFGATTIYATGSNANQDLGLKARGTGVVRVQSNLLATGAITPSTGSTSSTGIMFPTDPFGGTGDAAWVRYHNTRGGEKGTLEIGISNDADDHIVLLPSGNVGVGVDNPVAKLDVLAANRSGTHPAAVKGLYVTGGFGADSDGVEFRHTDGTQGIGFGYNTIYATGSAANQDLGLKARGTGVIKAQNSLQVTGTITVTGGKITPSTGNTWNEGIIFPTDQFGGSGNGAWITYHNTRGDKKGTLEIGISNTADDHIYLRTTGNVGVGIASPVAKLDVSAARSGTHPTAVKGLYVTGDFAADSDGVEFRHSNATQGIGFGFNTIYAAGSNANQDLGLKARGTGVVKVASSIQVSGYVAAQQAYFSAYLDLNTRSGAQNPLPMQQTSQNVGSGYSITTSKFTAPVKGVYLFTMTGFRTDESVTGTLYWYLMVNNANANNGGTTTTEGDERALMTWPANVQGTVSRTILLALNAGDLVHVKQDGSGRCDNYRSGLEGVLLYATL